MDNNSLNGFDVFESLLPGMKEKEDDKFIVGAGEEITEEELDNIKKGSDTQKQQKPKKDNKEVIDDDDDDDTGIEEDEDDDDNVVNKPVKKEIKEDTEENEQITEDNEETVVVNFFDSLSEKLNWGEIEDDEKPKTVDALIDYFTQVIEENSTPDYASDEVRQLDEFVRNGGELKKFFEIDAPLDLESLDIENNEQDQKAVLKEFLKEKGFSTTQINKKLTKYEDAGLLEDEANDALESLKEIRENKKQQLLKQQQKYFKEQQEKQRELYNSVVTQIKGLDNIRGIKVPDKDKRALIDYILKPDTDGQTKYYKDYVKGGVKNLIESAYFTMNADKLISAAETKGRNKAIDRFKKSLKTTSVTSKKTNNEDFIDNDNSIWSSAIRQLRMS